MSGRPKNQPVPASQSAIDNAVLRAREIYGIDDLCEAYSTNGTSGFIASGHKAVRGSKGFCKNLGVTQAELGLALEPSVRATCLTWGLPVVVQVAGPDASGEVAQPAAE